MGKDAKETGDKYSLRGKVYDRIREDILNGVSAERYCDHCEQVVTWRMWLGDTSLPYSSGHFRLIKDVELPDQYSMPADTDLVFIQCPVLDDILGKIRVGKDGPPKAGYIKATVLNVCGNYVGRCHTQIGNCRADERHFRHCFF